MSRTARLAAPSLAAAPRAPGAASAARAALVVMAKAPIAGAVKTRLSPPLSPTQAAELAAAFLLDTWRHALAAAGDAALLAVAGEIAHMPAALPRSRMVPQHGASLGERIMAAARAGLAHAPRVLVIGSDVPLLSTAALIGLCDAAAALGPQEICFGPSGDGGFYAVGLATDRADLFDGVRFSAPTTMNECIERAAGLELGIRLGPAHDDIDDAVGLAALRLTLAQAPTLAPHTAAALGVTPWA